MPASARHGSKTPANYEAAVQELEQLVAALESGQLPLDQLLIQYQRGADLLKFCQERLSLVENQIRLLDQGGMTPWNSEA